MKEKINTNLNATINKNLFFDLFTSGWIYFSNIDKGNFLEIYYFTLI